MDDMRADSTSAPDRESTSPASMVAWPPQMYAHTPYGHYHPDVMAAFAQQQAMFYGQSMDFNAIMYDNGPYGYAGVPAYPEGTTQYAQHAQTHATPTIRRPVAPRARKVPKQEAVMVDDDNRALSADTPTSPSSTPDMSARASTASPPSPAADPTLPSLSTPSSERTLKRPRPASSNSGGEEEQLLDMELSSLQEMSDGRHLTRDQKYVMMRRKNNQAARQSRQKRRQREQSLYDRCEALHRQNDDLRQLLGAIYEELKLARDDNDVASTAAQRALDAEVESLLRPAVSAPPFAYGVVGADTSALASPDSIKTTVMPDAHEGQDMSDIE